MDRTFILSQWLSQGVDPLESIRKPAYTGHNRCWPCTVVNAVLLAAAVAAVALFRPVAAAVLALGGSLAIWLRGYVVPYTPRFAPTLVARLPWNVFSHSPASDSLGDLESRDGEAVTEALIRAGVLVVDADRLGPSDAFATAWRARMDELVDASDEVLVDAATEALPGIDDARIETAGAETYLVLSGARTAWLRRPVAVAELGAVKALAETELAAVHREFAAHALCAFLENCPVCGTTLVEGPADDCCGNTVPAPGHESPDVLACEQCSVAFYTFEAGTDAEA